LIFTPFNILHHRRFNPPEGGTMAVPGHFVRNLQVCKGEKVYNHEYIYPVI
jgi:hypothetical protein